MHAAHKLPPEQAEWKRSLPEELRPLHGHIHRPFIKHLMDLVKFNDQEYSDGLDEGFGLVGLIQASGHGNHNTTSDTSTKAVADLLREARAQREAGQVRTASLPLG